tara:strand:+ start:525 stop:701 length:177 start_codon:yes stop_codon:yes gene_type:complete
MATTFEWILGILFIMGMSLLFFATFGSSKYDEKTIDEYMTRLENQILEEQRSGRVPPQ